MTRLCTSLDGRSSIVLSLLGLSLVTGLACRQWQLLLVHMAFFLCFSLTTLLTIVERLWQKLTTGLKPCSQDENLAPINDKHKLLAKNRRIITFIGSTACLICVWIPKLMEALPAEKGLSLTLQTAPVHAVVFFALGCLAFDLWFSSACCQPHLKPLSSIVQDAWTFIGLVKTFVVLSWKKGSNDVHKRVLNLRNNFENKITPKVQSKEDKASDTNDDIWIIHGKRYCMTEFVNHHPGGRESIMLGRGRDCTALFESCHPFTEHSRKILEKYGVSTEKAIQEEDVFYQVLCQRVVKILREQGIDPIQDRAATWQRVLYYFLVVLAVVASGVAHAKVSRTESFGSHWLKTLSNQS